MGSNLIKHAKKEFKVLGWPGTDEMQKLICDQVLKLLKTFSNHDHSGSSAPYAIDLFKNLASFGIIAPLTGKDEEWNEVSDGIFQNNRCSHVFRDKKFKNGKPYDIDGKIFVDPNDSTWTNIKSRVLISFPYTPKRKYVYRKKWLRLLYKIKKRLTNSENNA